MILIVIEEREIQIFSSIPLVEFTLFTKCLIIIFNIALKTSVSRVSSARKGHSLHQEVVLVHIRHKFKGNLYLFERVSYDFVISSTTFIGTCILSSRRFLNELFHLLFNLSFIHFYVTSGLLNITLHVRDHEKDQCYHQESWNSAK